MQKYADVVLDRKGNVVPGATVRVNTSAGAEAVLYAANGSSPISNPVITDNLGCFAFYAVNGRYNLQVYIGSALFTVSNDFLLEDPQDETPEVIKNGIIKDSALTNVTIDGKEPGYKEDTDALGASLLIIKGKTVVIGDSGYSPVGSNIDAAILSAITSGAKNIEIPDDRFEVTNTWRLPSGVNVKGRGGRFSKIVPKAGGDISSNGGRIIIGNGKTSPSIDNTTWQTTYPNMMSGEISLLQFINEDSLTEMNGLLLMGSYISDELWFDSFNQAVSRPTGLYADSFEIHRLFVQRALGNTKYQVEVQGLGDGFVMEGCHFPYDTINGWSTKGARIVGVAGGRIDNGIGGDYLIERCAQLDFRAGHWERGQHIYDSSNVNHQGVFLPDTRIPVITRGTLASSNNESRFICSFTNTAFRNIEGLMEWSGFHIQQGASVQIAVDNCYQEWSAQGDFSRNQQAGIRLCQEDGTTPLPSFNSYSYLTSKKAFVNIPYRVDLDHFIRCLDDVFTGLVSASTRVEAVGSRNAGVNQWKIATGTFYYNAQIMYDTTRAIGRSPTNSEVSATVSSLGTMVVLNASFGNKPRSGIIRLYRGTTPGVYDQFVDIHTIGSTWLHDDGVLVNGIAWVARTPGAMNVINSMGESLRFSGGLVEMVSTALPNTAGTWTKGDRITRIDSVVDANNMLLIGHHRLTSSSGTSTTTDWANLRTSTVSPAT
jgi:hypothetical protein